MDSPTLRLLEINQEGYPVSWHIDDVAQALDTGEMDADVAALLEEFNGYDGYDLLKHQEEGHREKVLARIAEARQIYDGFNAEMEMSERVRRVMNRISAFQPGYALPPFPIIFLYAGGRTGGRSMVGKAIVVNLGEVVTRFRKGELSDLQKVYDDIEDTMVHEGVHVLSFLMGTGNCSTRVPRFGGIWGEGAASLAERGTKLLKSIGREELRFWVQFLDEWRIAEESEERMAIINRCIDPTRNTFVSPDRLEGLRKWIEDGEDPEVIFTELLKRGGVIYTLGLTLWRSRLAKGENIPTLFREGPDKLEKWVKELAVELAE